METGTRALTTTQRKLVRSPHQPTGCWIRPERRNALNLRDAYTCVYCLRDLHGADPRDITLDHLTAKVDGGSNASENLVTACRSCNSSRGDKPLALFAGPETMKYIRRQTARKMPRYLKLAKAIMAGEVGGE